MAPAQCPRQVLIWSIPAIAVLISLFWYKRKKTLRSDPGGTTLQKSSDLVDSHSSKTNCVPTVDSDKVIAAIEKAIRDIETSRAIQEVVSVEEEEEEVRKVGPKEQDKKDIDILNKKKTTSGTYSQPVDQSNKKSTEVVFVVDSDTKELLETSLPVKEESISNNISELDCRSVNSVDKQQTEKLEKHITESASDSDIVVPAESSVINKSITEEIKKDIEIIDLVESSSDTSSDDSVIIDEKKESLKGINNNRKDTSVKNIASNTTNEINVVESPVICKKVNKVSSSKKRGNRKAVQENSIDKTSGITDNRDKKDSINEKKVVLSGDCIKEEKLKFKKESLVKTDNNKLKKDISNNKMELACSRVEQLGHNSSSSTINGNEAGLEQKLATLGLESSHNAEGGERDSANHSPAEVMLASPSMSNFSDAHSEGSSDSGKGCSDIPDISTPPSQTPAGGSSVAGDLIPSVYEFIIPQHMVGRLIGRHGVFLHDIRSKTHTHIFIKRHPDTTKLKICAIEGAQQDIDSALGMIRQKFPLRRFPNLTLEKVTFVNIMPSLFPLPQEQFQLQLIEGVNNDVILSSLISAGHFFLQQPTHPSYQSLCQLNLVMNTVYSSPEAPPLDTPLKDAVCAAPAMGGWYRAQIIDIDEDNKTVDVRFLDYGGFLTLETPALRKIRGDLMMLPFQAVECLLANVVPAGGEDAEWTEEARLFVQNLTCGQILQAHISEYTEQGIPLVFLYAMYCGQVVIVNQELVNRGYAETYTPTVSEE